MSGPQYSSQNITVLIMGAPTRVPLALENSHIDVRPDARMDAEQT